MSANRNQPCPCGSGKKAKRCCEDIVAKEMAQQKAWEDWVANGKKRAEERAAAEREEYNRKQSGNGPYTYKRSPGLSSSLVFAAAAMAMGGGFGGWSGGRRRG